MGERGRGSHRHVERPMAAGAHVGERVEEKDDVGVPLWMLLIDVKFAASRCRTPVDAADTVAGSPSPNVRELDPIALCHRVRSNGPT
jgi:hypothetical protein